MVLHLVRAAPALPATPVDAAATAALDATLAELRERVDRLTAGVEGSQPSAIAGLHLNRVARPGGPKPVMQVPAFAMILQGRKRLDVGADVLAYDPRHYLVSSLDLPVIATLTRASDESPYLGLRLDLDLAVMAEWVRDERLPAPPEDEAAAPARAAYVAPTPAPLADAVLRLVRLLDAPQEAGVLAPLAQREILFRLLLDPAGAALRRQLQQGSPSRRIATAIRRLRERYAEPLRIETLAREVHLSVSSLHHQFKAATAISPLQYQKQLRLQAAQRLLRVEGLSVAQAATQVGYDSPSQFSRDYVRMHGRTPSTERRRGQQGPGDAD